MLGYLQCDNAEQWAQIESAITSAEGHYAPFGDSPGAREPVLKEAPAQTYRSGHSRDKAVDRSRSTILFSASTDD